MPGRDLDGKGGLLCAIPPSEREGTTGFLFMEGWELTGVGGWGFVSEQVKERMRGVGTGGRSGSPSAALEAVKMGSGGVRWSLCGWSWSLPRPCDFAIEPYKGLSNISDTLSHSPLGNKGSVSYVSVSTESYQVLKFCLYHTNSTRNRRLHRI